MYILEWTGLRLSETLRKSENREECRELVAAVRRSSVVPLQSSSLTMR